MRNCPKLINLLRRNVAPLLINWKIMMNMSRKKKIKKKALIYSKIMKLKIPLTIYLSQDLINNINLNR